MGKARDVKNFEQEQYKINDKLTAQIVQNSNNLHSQFAVTPPAGLDDRYFLPLGGGVMQGPVGHTASKVTVETGNYLDIGVNSGKYSGLAIVAAPEGSTAATVSYIEIPHLPYQQLYLQAASGHTITLDSTGHIDVPGGSFTLNSTQIVELKYDSINRKWKFISGGGGGSTGTPSGTGLTFPLLYGVFQHGEVGDPAATTMTQVRVDLADPANPHIHAMTLTGNVGILFRNTPDTTALFFVLQITQDDVGGHRVTAPQSQTEFDISGTPGSETILTGMVVANRVYVTNYGSRITNVIGSENAGGEDWYTFPAQNDVDLDGNNLIGASGVNFASQAGSMSRLVPTTTSFHIIAGARAKSVQLRGGNNDLFLEATNSAINLHDKSITGINALLMNQAGQSIRSLTDTMYYDVPDDEHHAFRVGTEQVLALEKEGNHYHINAGDHNISNVRNLFFTGTSTDNFPDATVPYLSHEVRNNVGILKINIPTDQFLAFSGNGVQRATLTANGLLDVPAINTPTLHISGEGAASSVNGGIWRDDNGNVIVRTGNNNVNLSNTDITNWSSNINAGNYNITNMGTITSARFVSGLAMGKINLGNNEAIRWSSPPTAAIGTTAGITRAADNNITMVGANLSMLQNSIVNVPHIESSSGTMTLKVPQISRIDLDFGGTLKWSFSQTSLIGDNMIINNTLAFNASSAPVAPGFSVVRDSEDVDHVYVYTGGQARNLTTALGGGGTTTIGDISLGAINASMIPDTNETYNLGSSARQWDRIYADSVVTGGNLQVGGSFDHNGSTFGIRGQLTRHGRPWLLDSEAGNPFRQQVQVGENINTILLARAFNTLVSDLREQGILV